LLIGNDLVMVLYDVEGVAVSSVLSIVKSIAVAIDILAESVVREETELNYIVYSYIRRTRKVINFKHEGGEREVKKWFWFLRVTITREKMCLCYT
jgi:hypothetical protein